MTYETTTTLPAAEILERAKTFFAERVPQVAAYPERQGDTWLTLRGQGGEEVAIAIFDVPGGRRVRGSTLFFDQALDRFLSTLPAMEEVA